MRAIEPGQNNRRVNMDYFILDDNYTSLMSKKAYIYIIYNW